jgi:alkanesulfonate monooxygenase SsuD/methylene tetrahydromethanopterin reductase-like flavin-dependent oxidoreductase (luciferase family)
VFIIGITDHLEGPGDRPSSEVYRETIEFVQLADSLGVTYSWFAEHHAHAHRGHLPAPLLIALHLAGVTRQIHLGMAVTCLNQHPALQTAEQIAVADHLMNHRLAPGFGSGSTPAEAKWLGLDELSDDQERHRRFAAALQVIRNAWEPAGLQTDMPFLPRAAPDLRQRTWIAVNSAGAATIAGQFGANVLFSHLRTVEQHKEYVAAYRAAGGTGLVAMNRPVYVGRTDAAAFAEAEPALRILWRRFRAEGKIAAEVREPDSVEGLCGHPINFIVGGRDSVLEQLRALRQACPFDVANLELRWEGLSHEQTLGSLRELMGTGHDTRGVASLPPPAC